MTKKLLSLVALTGLANVSMAHVPGADESLFTSISHVVFGAHHLPALLLLAGFLGVVTFAIYKRRSTRDED